MDVFNLLIIDDDPNIRSLLNELLAGRPDLRLFIAGSGPEAVQHFAANRVDVVLTDIHMPGFTGLELMADMKKINFKPEILVMTANATPENVETARRIGARSVILKPFDDLEVIEAEINNAVAAARSARGRGNGHGVTHPAAAHAAAPPPPIQPPAAAPPARPVPAAGKPAPAPPPPAVKSVPVSGALPDFDAWDGELTGNETPPAAAAPAAAPRVPPLPAPHAPPAPPRPVTAQGLRAVPPAPPAPPAAPPAQQAPPVHHAPPAHQAVAASRVASATVPPVATTPPVAAAAPVPVAAPASAAPRVVHAPRPAAAAPAPMAAAAQAVAVHTDAAGETAPPLEEAVPEIPADLESIFRTATRFDAGKMRMQAPIVCLQTWEEKGAIAALRRLAASLQREFYVWSAGRGLVKESGQAMGDLYREPARALEFIRRHRSNGLYVLADFRPCLEDKMVVRILREMVMELETSRSMLVLTAPRLPVPPELQPVCVGFDWPAGGQADPQALYEEVAEEVAAATGLGIDLPGAEREALLKRVKEMPAGRARFEIARALMARAG